jgi:hypothetical protein
VEGSSHLIVFGDRVPVVENRDASRCKYPCLALPGDFAFAVLWTPFGLDLTGREGYMEA